MESNTMIKVEHLSKSFDGLMVLKDINTEIKKGDVISVIGPSGTGKSTFLRCLNLLEKPSGGSIEIGGVNILDKKVEKPVLRRKMGMVFQSFNLFEHLSVRENLTIGPIKLLGKSRQEADGKALELLKMVGLSDKIDVYPDQLSGGQKQRVAIARCLSLNPEIILFDEPTSALDPTMVSEVLGVIRQLAKDGMTMVVVTHEMNFARDVSNRVFYMDEGIIYEDADPKTIFENPAKEKTRIFINRIRNLQFSIPNKNYDLYALNAEIEKFAKKYFFSKERTNSLLLITEELLQILPLDGGVLITMEYSEKTGKVHYIIKAGSVNCKIVDSEETDEISRSIIKGLSSGLSETITADGLLIEMDLNQ